VAVSVVAKGKSRVARAIPRQRPDRVIPMNRAIAHVGLHNDLLVGKREFNSRFCSASGRSLKAGELLVAGAGSGDAVYRLRAGWACQFRDLCDGRRAILDVYLPGDVLGLDAALHTRPVEKILTLTSITVEAIHAETGLRDLMGHRPTALYIAWLLGQRQRRADRLLTAISCLDARGRLAMMVLDFYKRLHLQRLMSTIYSLPLTQSQIGSYLGLTVVHVNRVLRSLRDERIVNLEKHCVTILNIEQLTKLAQSGELGAPARSISAPPVEQPALLAS
jgi:CRP/FNR family transcriptional regulator, anaerobic regulatory protein